MHRKTLWFALCLSVFVHANASPSLAKLPLRFERARDPIEYGRGGHAEFVARGNGYTLYLAESGAILSTQSATLRMQIADGNPSPKIAAQGLLPGMTNYLVGNDPSRWRTGVAGFANVKYRGIYPGIDLMYYGNRQQLEYDFVVAPGADTRRIQIVFDGAKNLKIDRNGDLVMRASGQLLRFRKPLLYQDVHGEKRPVAGQYTLRGRQVGFAVSSYDASLPLVIDPVLVYSTLFGGEEDAIFGLATDQAGNVYLTGQTLGFIPILNAEQSKFGGSYTAGVPNAFITKINAAGTALIYSTYIGGSESNEHSGGDRAFGIAVDAAGNAYITGFTVSTDFPTVHAIQSTLPAPIAAFVTKLNAAGDALVYSTYLGGSGKSSGNCAPVSFNCVLTGDRGNAIAVDSAGNAYVAGSTTSSDFPVVTPFQAALPGPQASFVTKIDAAGSALVYSTYLGGSTAPSGGTAQDSATGIAVDSTGSAYVTGNACSSNFPTANPIQADNKSACSAFITKLAPSGSTLVYSTYLGGSGGALHCDAPSLFFDHGSNACGGNSSAGIAVDSAGSAYVVGTTRTTDFPMVNAFQPANGAASPPVNAFVAKLNASGSALTYSTYLGGIGGAGASAVAVDSAGNAYITGAAGAGFPLVQPLQTSFSAGNGGAAFVAELNAAGAALVYSTYFGNESGLVPAASAVTVDSVGNTHFSGGAGPNFPVANAIQTVPAGPHPEFGSAFLAKIGPADAAGLATMPAALDFSKAFFGTSQTVTLLAAGSQPLNIASITASGDFTETNNCGAVLAAGSTCTVNIVFAPTIEGSRDGTLTITSNAGSPLSVSLTGFGLRPSLTGAALNAASFSGANAAGSLASVFGTDLVSSVGATVTVTGSSGTYPAAVLYVSPTQINFQIPWEVAGSSQVTLKVDFVSIPMALSATAPAIFALNSQGTGPGAILISNMDLFAQPAGSVPGRSSQPVSRGQFISVYATGLGALTMTPPPDGSPPASQLTIAATATVSIGGVTVTPSFAGLAPGFVGLYQVDAQVPASVTPGSVVPVSITVGGVVSNTVTIAVL
jgi:uncharacterized protein (TIGR03437 family)